MRGLVWYVSRLPYWAGEGCWWLYWGLNGLAYRMDTWATKA